MSGWSAQLPPPEVPDEFADAYREAYERALLDQTNAARHRRPPQYRPGYTEPTAPPAVSTEPVETKPRSQSVELVETAPSPVAPIETEPQQSQPVEPAETRASPDIDLPVRLGRLIIGTHRDDDPGESWFDEVRESRWFVPALLVALALALVIGAYVVGRLFTAAVGTS